MSFPQFRLALPFVCVALFGSLSVLAGCKSPDAGARGEGALAVPPSGSIRLVSTGLEQSAARAHWKWTIIGDRNWREATAESGERAATMALVQTYPLNSVTDRGGCNTWECDLLVTRTSEKADSAAYVVTLHGSNGFTATAKGTIVTESGGDLPIEIAQKSDTLARMPADVALATVGKTPITLRIAE